MKETWQLVEQPRRLKPVANQTFGAFPRVRLAEEVGCREVHSRRLFVGLGPLDRCTETAGPRVEPRQLPGELHARRATTTDQPRLWLVIQVRIIGVRECRHETGNLVRRASVEATSVVGDRARVRRFRRIRSLRISGRPAQTAAALAGACGQAASHPDWGHRGADSGSFRTSIELSEHDGHCMQPVRRAFPLSPHDSPILQPHVPKS